MIARLHTTHSRTFAYTVRDISATRKRRSDLDTVESRALRAQPAPYKRRLQPGGTSASNRFARSWPEGSEGTGASAEQNMRSTAPALM